jgi:hypothetical protein
LEKLLITELVFQSSRRSSNLVANRSVAKRYAPLISDFPTNVKPKPTRMEGYLAYTRFRDSSATHTHPQGSTTPCPRQLLLLHLILTPSDSDVETGLPHYHLPSCHFHHAKHQQSTCSPAHKILKQLVIQFKKYIHEVRGYGIGH